VPSVQQRAGAAAVALIGDFNSYTAEDPPQVLYGSGYRNAAPDEWSYSFGGLAGPWTTCCSTAPPGPG
jgi:5'-nucleotidase